ncbi:MAG TPA: hypothetical protein ENI52_02505 [Thermoplasmata archaeon]|nr:hypothetical protein [Thermoplasmata archaeon]
MKFGRMFIAGMIVVAMLLPSVYAKPIVWHNTPRTGTNAGDIFRLKFEILANETANYTIKIDSGENFAPIDGNYTINLYIPKNETRTFIFDMEVVKEIKDGKYPIYWDAYINGKKFNSGKAYVRAGEQAPGFELIAFISAVLLAIIIWKRKK